MNLAIQQRAPPMSEWLNIMLEEVRRKQREAVDAADERKRRDQDRYDANSSGNADGSTAESGVAGKGAEL